MYREETKYDEVMPAPTTVEQRKSYWSAAVGLQTVDGLEVTDFGHSLGRSYVEGEQTADQIVSSATRHYADVPVGNPEREADEVATRITALLETTSFSLSPRTLFSIHGTLFNDVLPSGWAGRKRQTNLTKPEPVLGGRSVTYADYRQIAANLEYDFEEERVRRRKVPLRREDIRSLSRFVANVWQSHPFREGNTRAVAAFLVLYLRTLGVQTDNAPFALHSEYFRDALVRASFSSIELGVDEDLTFLQRFLENVALGLGHDLSSDDLNVHGIRTERRIPYRNDHAAQSLSDQAEDAKEALAASMSPSGATQANKEREERCSER